LHPKRTVYPSGSNFSGCYINIEKSKLSTFLNIVVTCRQERQQTRKYHPSTGKWKNTVSEFIQSGRWTETCTLSDTMMSGAEVFLFPLEAYYCEICYNDCTHCICSDSEIHTELYPMGPIVCRICCRKREPISCPKCQSHDIITPPEPPYEVQIANTFIDDLTDWIRHFSHKEIIPQRPVAEEILHRTRTIIRIEKHPMIDSNTNGEPSYKLFLYRYTVGKTGKRTPYLFVRDYPKDIISDVVHCFEDNIWQCNCCGYVWQRWYDERLGDSIWEALEGSR